MKEKYIDLMEKTLTAYTDDHIRDYFSRVKTEGLTEHGFPRLTVNIGILIAHGRRRDLLPLFCEMMEFCCYTIPRVKAANDFSVREIICCIMELERTQVVPSEDIARWRGYLATIEPTKCYDKFATYPTEDIRNWALFTGVSEYFRQMIGLCDSTDFIDLQLASQLQFLDENGMYKDHKGTEVHQPMMYDIVPRGLFSLLLHFGYRGVHYEAIDACLRRAGRLMLEMQSVTGEMAFGGRSNQFLHNEPWCIAIYEFEANRYAREGDMVMAARFKAAVEQAVAVTEAWLAREPIYHIKNRFPTASKFGCEKYAYFDKYMITNASNLYVAYLICDDTLTADGAPAPAPVAWESSRHFHKVFLRYGEYSAEYDTNGDPQYDAGGLGRIHRRGAPSAICMSVPCPVQPNYSVGDGTPVAMSLCAGRALEDGWKFSCDPDVIHQTVSCGTDDDGAHAEILCRFADEGEVRTHYTVSDSGVTIVAKGAAGERIAHTLPAFCFDGETAPEIRVGARTLEIAYDGWICRYTTDGTVRDTGLTAYNRNGHYRVFAAEGTGTVTVKVEIVKQ